MVWLIDGSHGALTAYAHKGDTMQSNFLKPVEGQLAAQHGMCEAGGYATFAAPGTPLL